MQHLRKTGIYLASLIAIWLLIGCPPLNATKLAGAIDIDPLDEVLAELEVDPLDALIAELNRIEGHETLLQDAVANNKAVVVHPRPEVWHLR